MGKRKAKQESLWVSTDRSHARRDASPIRGDLLLLCRLTQPLPRPALRPRNVGLNALRIQIH